MPDSTPAGLCRLIAAGLVGPCAAQCVSFPRRRQHTQIPGPPRCRRSPRLFRQLRALRFMSTHLNPRDPAACERDDRVGVCGSCPRLLTPLMGQRRSAGAGLLRPCARRRGWFRQHTRLDRVTTASGSPVANLWAAPGTRCGPFPDAFAERAYARSTCFRRGGIRAYVYASSSPFEIQNLRHTFWESSSAVTRMLSRRR